MTQSPDALYVATPGSRWRSVFIALGWLCFLVSLTLPFANLNRVLRWQGDYSGLQFMGWLVLGIPAQILHFLRTRQDGYLSVMDIAWWIVALAAMVLFLISPLLVRRTFTPPTLLILRYLALVLLLFPVTACLPMSVRFPQPHLGMVLLAAGHACVLIAFWCPWPHLAPRAAYFPVTLSSDPSPAP